MAESALCSFAHHCEKPCGTSARYLNRTACVSISACERDVHSHLKSVRLLQSGISTEKELILIRAGFIEVKKSGCCDAMTLCPRHGDELGLQWRKKRPAECKHPLEQNWNILVPVGSG